MTRCVTASTGSGFGFIARSSGCLEITIAAAEVVVGLALIVRLAQRKEAEDPVARLEAMIDQTEIYDRPAAD